jgi:hypothetical protein
MKTRRFVSPNIRRLILAGAVAAILCFLAVPAISADTIDPEADKVLKSMSDYLGGTKAFSMNADADFEIVGLNGQIFQLSSLVTIVMERPAKFHISRKGMIADAEFIFDGETLTLQGKKLNVYAQIQVSGTIDDAIRAYEFETGLPAPGADLLFADPYAILSSGVKSGEYVGIAYVNGVECHYLAFRDAKVDWQLWVKTGDEPLPMKYVITNKWVTGAPQYQIRLRDWNTSPKMTGKQFAFSAPKGATKLETMPVNEMGDFTTTEGGQK